MLPIHQQKFIPMSAKLPISSDFCWCSCYLLVVSWGLLSSKACMLFFLVCICWLFLEFSNLSCTLLPRFLICVLVLRVLFNWRNCCSFCCQVCNWLLYWCVEILFLNWFALSPIYVLVSFLSYWSFIYNVFSFTIASFQGAFIFVPTVTCLVYDFFFI